MLDQHALFRQGLEQAVRGGTFKAHLLCDIDEANPPLRLCGDELERANRSMNGLRARRRIRFHSRENLSTESKYWTVYWRN
jgi:hypothetical protein